MDKLIADIGYPPVELIFILQKIIEHHEFNQLPEETTTKVKQRYGEISQRHNAGAMTIPALCL